MKTIRTDADVMKIANRIDDLSWQIQDLIDKIGQSEHPNASKIEEALLHECCFFSWANHIAHSHLSKPEQWDALKSDSGNGRYYHKAATKAVNSRRAAARAFRVKLQIQQTS